MKVFLIINFAVVRHLYGIIYFLILKEYQTPPSTFEQVDARVPAPNMVASVPTKPNISSFLFVRSISQQLTESKILEASGCGGALHFSSSVSLPSFKRTVLGAEVSADINFQWGPRPGVFAGFFFVIV